jgi:hypothetical protein
MSGLISMTKFAAGLAASLSVGKVIEDIIKHNTTVVTRFDSVTTHVGGFVLGMIVVDKARETFNKQWDEAAKMWKESKAEDEDAEKKEK